MSKKINLKDLFGGLQNQMTAQLNTNRDFINHPSLKGDSLENTWIEWLRKYLPNRYCVDKAVIIDSTGQVSDQIDLVIYDQQYTPFVLKQNGVYFIPAEGVYAVFEVKPDLQGTVQIKEESISYIEYAGRKIESVRKLKRTSAKILDRGKPRNERPLSQIVGGILTSMNSFVKQETITKHLQALSGLQALDLGCSVAYGSILVEYKGEEDQEEKNLQKRINDFYHRRRFQSVNFSDEDSSLVTFFLELMRYLQQRIGTVGAIDLGAYLKAIQNGN